MERVGIIRRDEPRDVRYVPRQHARVLVKLGRWDYLPVTAVEPVVEVPVVVDALDGVRFTSALARDAAVAAGLTAAAFDGRDGSGREGAFSKPDVLALIADFA